MNGNCPKTVLITGGSRGIGAACVRKFAQAGWQVAFTYKDSGDKAQDITQELTRQAKDLAQDLIRRSEDPAREPTQAQDLAEGPAGNSINPVLPIHLDLADPEELEYAIAQAREYFGVPAFDAFVGNAGISKSGLIQDMTEDDIEELIRINLEGNIRLTREIAPQMISAKAGSIILVSSIWGERGAAMESVYSATKAGLMGFAKSLAKELGPSGIRVNTVLPGVIDTDMNSGYSKEDIQELVALTPLGRLGTPEDVANLIYFLASEESAFVTGQAIGVDGGAII